MNLFGDVTCSSCGLETRFLLERKGEETFLMLGDTLKREEGLSEYIECDYCQSLFCLHVVILDDVISAFLNDKQWIDYSNGELLLQKATPNQGLEKEKKKELKQFHESFHVPFETQPFEVNHEIEIANDTWKVLRVFKKEGIEKDLSKRLLTPTLDEYWYEVVNIKQEKRWCIVTNTKEEEAPKMFAKKKKSFSKELKRVTYENEWYEFGTSENKEQEENNAILMIEAPFLKDNETKHDVTDSLFTSKLLFEKMLTQNLCVKAYEYVSGIRMFVFNREGELEADIFGETMDEVLETLQDHYSISSEEF